MRPIKILSTALLGVVLLTQTSAAQGPAPRGPPCAERSDVVAQLRNGFGEHLIGSGLANGGFVFELHVGQTGSWTVIATTPQGMSCLVAAGEAWEPRPTPDIFARR